MLDSYSPCCPYDLFIMGLFSFFSVNAINRRAYVRLEDMIQDRFGTKLTQFFLLTKYQEHILFVTYLMNIT